MAPHDDTDILPLTYPSEKNVAQHGAISVGSSARITQQAAATLLGRGIGKALVDALRAGGKVTQIITGKEWVIVRIRLLAPMDGADPYASVAPDDLKPM